MSRVRNKQYNTIHHLTSRIAHGVFFLEEAERNDFLSIAKRVSAFTGVELFGWCIMNNHFHLYVYLPEPPSLSDDEVLARFHLLKGDSARLLLDETGAESQTGAEGLTLRASLSDDPESAHAELVRLIRRRMYSVAEYTRMIKQWFTEDYNARTGHKGTMWQAVYGDHALFLPEDAADYDDLRDILAYIHLNPIRAAITDRFDGYAWSSYAAYRKGDPDAVKAMRFAYSGFDQDAEIVEIHEMRMNRLLEEWKRKRAEEIVRKRLAGCEAPSDPLTDECMIEQATNHAREVQKELERLHAERDLAEGTKARRDIICREISCAQILHPDFSASDISALIDAPLRTVQRYLLILRQTNRIDNAA